MKASKFHNNKKIYNWLVYKIMDNFLEKNSKYYKGHLVDLGCGEMPYRDYFLNFVHKYTGVDWEYSYHNVKPDVVSNLNEKIELEDNVADTIVCISVLEHLCEPQVFLNECYRILKREGYLILQVPFMWWVHESPYDYFRYTPYGLKYLFEKSGFKVISIEPQAGIFTTLFLKFNYFTLRFTSIRFFGILIRLFLIPLWFLLQVLAPIFDKLDRNWELETCGYFVVAEKV